MKISIFTPTKGRLACLDLCKQFAAAQTYPVHEHVIEDGGTLAENLRSGLLKVTGDAVVIFEDDDYYAPGWVGWCAEHLEERDIVGEQMSRFYHVPTRGYAILDTGQQRASLYNTAFRSDLIPDILSVVDEDWIDLKFWALSVKSSRRMCTNPGPEIYVVGLKGLPGTRGMSFGHIPDYYQQHHHDDESHSVLRSWVGSELAETYLYGVVMYKIIVCGLGPDSIEPFREHAKSFCTIGVNDIDRYFAPDHLVLINQLDTTREDKAVWIRKTRAKTVWATDLVWLSHPNIRRIEIHPIGDKEPVTHAMLDAMLADEHELLSWIMSPYAAVMLAYKLGAQRIGLLGVDLTESCNLHQCIPETIMKFGELREVLAQRGVDLVNLSQFSRCLGSLPLVDLASF